MPPEPAPHPAPDRATLRGAVSARYEALAGCAGSLSCGDALTLADPRPGEVVVDLGSGRGRDVLRAAERVGPSGQAIGIDLTPAMIDAARASIPPSLGNVRFVCCDLAALELPSASADVIVSSCAINHAPDKAAVYREIARVLKPGARFVVSDVVAERELPASVREDPAAWAACYGGAIPEAEYLAAVHRAGLRELRISRRTAPYEKGGVLVRSITLDGRRSER